MGVGMQVTRLRKGQEQWAGQKEVQWQMTQRWGSNHLRQKAAEVTEAESGREEQEEVVVVSTASNLEARAEG